MEMSELVLEHLRALRAVIDSINGKVDQLTVRVGSIEQGIAVLHQDVSNLRSIVAEQGTRLDRLTDRVGRIEQRLELAGASFGLQAGVQSADVILVFRSERGLDSIVNGKVTLGADAGVAAGPVGRNAAAATDGQLKAEIWSWSRARGLFAGIALDGAVLSIDNGANSSTYGNAVTPRAVFEGRAPQAPSAAIVAFRDALEEATASARQARGGTPAPVIPAADPGAASVQPLYSDNPATTTPLDAAPVQPVKP